MTISPFSTSYAEARTKFLHAAATADATLWSYEHPLLGPNGETLQTDCAWIGPKDATSVLVLSSATHGVEGFCGSGAQTDWLLRNEHLLLGPHSAVLLIHALNPYGFAWKRRVTHENVDLNRNFVDFNSPLPSNPHYEKLASVITPLDWSEETQVRTRKSILEFARTFGFDELGKTVSGGQHSHPDGIFFGGTEPTWSRLTLEKIFAEHLQHATNIGIVDFHTGLGPTGYAEPIITTHPDSAETHRAFHWFGLAAKTIAGGDSASADIDGDWLSAAPTLLPHARVTGISLEYGTVPSNQVLDALRADNWLHTYGDPKGPEASKIKSQILAAFYVDTDEWRGMVLGQSLMTIRQAMNGLSEMADKK